MPNKNYVKGVKKERLYVNRAKSMGLISFRSAGSHSPIDVVVIDMKTRNIGFIQCKPDSMAQIAKDRILDELKELSGAYTVRFNVL